jgi:hypothetical protein
MKERFLLSLMLTGICLTSFSPLANGQFLSHLDARKNDALFTTYASPMARSDYKSDQGYQFMWSDPENGAELTSRDGLNIGIAFDGKDGFRFRLKELYLEPVITTSYSDLVSYYFYPYPEIRIEVFFDVYSSKLAIQDIRITNEGKFPAEISVLPYFYYPSGDTINDIVHENPFSLFSFPLHKKRDGWMVDHSIPLTENYRGYFAGSVDFDSTDAFVISNRTPLKAVKSPVSILRKSIQSLKKNSVAVKGMIFCRNYRLEPGDITGMRNLYCLEDATVRMQDTYRSMRPGFEIDPARLIREDEKQYGNVQDLFNKGHLFGKPVRMGDEKVPDTLHNRDLRMFFWSCFSLLRQCMMPPEGECSYNYYIFSREPKWGWGYGGQVFHESLSMLAYAYMDPVSAMNSQRVYFERQHKDGYINYRTGPYLDETIEYKGKLTSSAPWFNYENLEIFKISHDRQFLRDAYESGSKFYRYYVANRDSNNNGLCEWGAEASLESVRDARVAVWDNVGWPSNFEGPDVNSMLVKEAKSLGEMAHILGLKEEEKNWDTLARQRSRLINRYMWDEETGFYYNINRDDQSFTYHKKDDLKIREITGFLPLWAGVAGSSGARTLVERMKDPLEFWRPFGVPTLSARDDYYNPMGYWNGPVWVQWDYLLFRGLLEYGYRKEAEELAYRVIDNMIRQLKKDHVFWEFYSPDDPQAGWNRTYIWAGIAARFLADLGKSNEQ